jgi:tripartite-type tricarboxylate transporter receptor subunit TctC
VPYKAEAAVHSDLFGELLDFAWANPSTARAQVQGGKMKVLGIAGTRRVSTMPNGAHLCRAGLPGV